MVKKSGFSIQLMAIIVLSCLFITGSPVMAQKEAVKKPASGKQAATAEEKDKVTKALKKDKAEPRKVTFNADDGLIMTGTYYPAKGEKVNAVVLAHNIQGSRKDWGALAAYLQGQGFSVLAYDLRGFGESANKQDGEHLSHLGFTEEDYAKMIADMKHAVDFVATQDRVKKNFIGLVGADLGANVALNYAMDDERVKSVVLISPNFNYKGIKTREAMLAYGKRPAMFCCSEGDIAPAHSSRKLHAMALGKKELKLYKTGSGHGTEIIQAQVGIVHDIADWFKDTL